MKKWQADHLKIEEALYRHREAGRNYIAQGIRLLDIVQNASDIFSHKGQEERTELIRFVMSDSVLANGMVVPTFKPPLDIIHKLAVEARCSAEQYEIDGENERRLLRYPKLPVSSPPRSGLELF